MASSLQSTSRKISTEVRKMYEKTTKEFMKEVEENMKALAEETDKINQSAFFKAYLETMSKFWQYNYHRQLLIHHTMPKAAKVAKFRKWKQLNRHVTKGTHPFLALMGVVYTFTLRVVYL